MEMVQEKIIEIKNLSKSFGDVKAVQDLSFCVNKGEFFAFLGVNGAGKSTTISIMCGQLERDGGEVIISGKDIKENITALSSKLGIVFQNSALDKSLTVKDNLVYRGALYGITGEKLQSRLDELDELLGIKELYKRTVGKLSGGQRRRIDIARALIHAPEILILDEPTTGLDPQTRKMLWDAIAKLRQKNQMTVFLTTHYMEETADADYVVILDSGKIVAQGSPLQLKNQYVGDYINIYGEKEEAIKNINRPYISIPDGFRIEVKSTHEATKLILEHPDVFVDYEIIKGKMDDVFLAVTGKKLLDATWGENE